MIKNIYTLFFTTWALASLIQGAHAQGIDECVLSYEDCIEKCSLNDNKDFCHTRCTNKEMACNGKIVSAY